MPNYCYYEMKVVGKRKNINEFINILKADYDYEKNEFSFNRHMFRIFSAEIYKEKVNDKNGSIVFIRGNCAWSVFSCMFAGGYYSDSKKSNKNNFKGTTIIQESYRLNLDIEIFSYEPGMCFQEHYLIKHGSLQISEESDWFPYDLDGYKTKEEIEKTMLITITNEEFLSSILKTGRRFYVEGDSKDFWIKDYNVRFSSIVEILEAPKKKNKKVFVRIFNIDGESVDTFIKKSIFINAKAID